MKKLVCSGFVLITICIFLTSANLAYAQAPHSEGGDPLTQEQKDYCAIYHIDPCTNNNILAKERVATGENGYNGYQLFQTANWLTIGIGLGAIFAFVAVGILVIKLKRKSHANRVT